MKEDTKEIKCLVKTLTLRNIPDLDGFTNRVNKIFKEKIILILKKNPSKNWNTVNSSHLIFLGLQYQKKANTMQKVTVQTNIPHESRCKNSKQTF